MTGRLITRRDTRVDVTALVDKFGEAVIAYGDREVTISKDGQVRLSAPVKEDALAAPAGVMAKSRVKCVKPR